MVIMMAAFPSATCKKSGHGCEDAIQKHPHHTHNIVNRHFLSHACRPEDDEEEPRDETTMLDLTESALKEFRGNSPKVTKQSQKSRMQVRQAQKAFS